MKTYISRTILEALLLLSTLNLQLSTLFAQGTAFTYQGRLAANGSPYTGFAEMQFTLFSVPNGGAAIAANTPAVTGVNVSGGLFTVPLDFGAGAFSGPDRWLEIQVRTNLSAFITLSPRQALTPTPYALFARTAGAVVNNSVTAASIAGGQVVKSLNGLKDAVNLVASTNVTLRSNGNDLSVSAGPWLPNGNSTFYNGGNVGIGTTTPGTSLHIATAGDPAMILQDTGPDGTQQTGYISFRNANLAETAWVGFGTAGNPDFSIVNARSGGDIVLSPFSGNVGIGTDTPAAKLEVRGDIRLGPSGELRATSGEENLRIVRGEISSSGTVVRGSGFTAQRNSAATYVITFNTPFAGTPSVVATAHRSPFGAATEAFYSAATDGVTVNGVTIVTRNLSAADWQDKAFEFIAIGPR